MPEFLDGLIERLHAEAADTLKKIAEGDWSDETQEALRASIEQFADDFGYDLDEEGQPLSDEPTRCAREEGRKTQSDDELATATTATRPKSDRGASRSGRRPTRSAMALKDVKSRIASVKNIQKITRAMEMVAAARLRRAEQRIEALRPYAGAIRRMTRQAAEAAGHVPNLPILNEHESEEHGRRSCSSPATAASPARSTRRSSAPASAPASSTRATASRPPGTRPAAAACRR